VGGSVLLFHRRYGGRGQRNLAVENRFQEGGLVGIVAGLIVMLIAGVMLVDAWRSLWKERDLGAAVLFFTGGVYMLLLGCLVASV
jgi:hypothetical protein